MKSIISVFIFSASLAHAVLSTQAECLKAGGTWQTWTKYEGAHGMQSCRLKAPDAGKLCSDGKECSTTLCEYLPAEKHGACSKYRVHSGCHSWMKDGVAHPIVCVD